MRSPWLDAVGSIIGLFGQTEVALGLALGVAVARWRRSPRDAVVPLFIVATIAAEALLKIVIPHAPPPAERAHTVALLPLLHVPFVNSFPSGHVARVTFLAGVVHGIPAWVRVVAVVLMVASRVYLGEHWLSDCLGGLVLGGLVLILARRFHSARSPT